MGVYHQQNSKNNIELNRIRIFFIEIQFKNTLYRGLNINSELIKNIANLIIKQGTPPRAGLVFDRNLLGVLS